MYPGILPARFRSLCPQRTEALGRTQLKETANPNDEYSFVVSNEQSGQRLDLFLSRVIPDLSRSHFKKLIKEDLVLVNGTPVKPSYETRAGDLIMARVPGPGAG